MYHIGYTSRADHRIKMPELENLCERSSANNQKAGITGLLVHDGSRFMQVIEGDFENVCHLMDKIVADTRHYQISYIAKDHTDARNFQDWGLACIGLNSRMTPVDLLDDVKAIVHDVADVNLMAAFIGFARLAK